MRPLVDFWRGKRVLVTGHTGFKGAWLALWLRGLGAEVTGVALSAATQPNLFTLLNLGQTMSSHVCDIRNAEALKSLVLQSQPDIVFHLAAQALVRASYQHPLDTFSTNIMGTANLLDAVRGVDSVRVVIVVTSDKVYQNRESPYPYREDDALGGHDPYSASKAAAELVLACYRVSFFEAGNVALASARAGNVIGGGDWSADRLIPDAVRAWNAGNTLDIRRPEAIRPWQHVLEPLGGYLALAQHLWHYPNEYGAFNFGPETSAAATVRDVVALAQTSYGYGQVKWGDGTEGPHEANWLALETAKVRTVLGVKPCWALPESVRRTLHWYRQQHAGADAHALCLADIAAYESANSLH